MGVLIDNRQNNLRIPLGKIEQKAQVVLSALGFPDGELSILMVDDPQIAALNRKYLYRSGPTNVIAFPMREGDFSHISPQLLGDVVISVETAQQEAHAAGISLEKRLTQILVHGILHLLGYDHEKTKSEALRMESKSDELMKWIDLPAAK